MSFSRRSFIASAGSLAGAIGGAVRAAAEPQPSRNVAETLDKRSRSPALIVEAVARHAVGARFEDLDAATVAATKLRVIDLIGCAIGGVAAGGNAALIEVIAASGGKPEASVVGYPVRGPVGDVAMANAIISRSYDFEVMTAVMGKKAVPSHHSPTTCMTALALCERDRLSGKQFLAALAVGDDIAARLLVASGLDFGQGWDGSPVYSALAATAIAARLRGLSARQTQDAFGLAVDQIGGTIQNIWDGATDFKLPQGAVARNAILAVELAARGWTGMGDALLAPFGLYAQYTAGCESPELLTQDLGKRFYAEEYFKPYPACMAAHPSIDCALALRAKHRVDPDKVAAVSIRLPAATLKNFCAKPFEARRFPHADANFSYQFLVANAMLRGGVRQEHYAEAAIRSPEMTRMLSKVQLEPLAPGRTGLEIEVRLTDAAVLSERHGDLADRHPFARPATRGDIVQKFHQQAAFSGFVSTDHADAIIARIDALDREPDMAAFVALVTRAHFKSA